jgi:hypothetical protein
MSQFVGQNQDGTYGEKFDWSKGEKVDWKKLATSPFFTGSTYQQVLCKDGTTRTQENNPNARIMDACRNNGGRADLPNPYEVTCKDGTKDVSNGKNPPCIYNGGVKNSNSENTVLAPQSFIEKNKTNLLIAGAIVLGYFAYKKFKNT